MNFRWLQKYTVLIHNINDYKFTNFINAYFRNDSCTQFIYFFFLAKSTEQYTQNLMYTNTVISLLFTVARNFIKLCSESNCRISKLNLFSKKLKKKSYAKCTTHKVRHFLFDIHTTRSTKKSSSIIFFCFRVLPSMCKMRIRQSEIEILNQLNKTHIYIHGMKWRLWMQPACSLTLAHTRHLKTSQ